MKSYIKTLIFAGVLAAMSSCTDLDTPIYGDYTVFPNNPIAVQSDFENCYNWQRNEAWFGRNFWEGAALSTDDLAGIHFAGTYDDGGRFFKPSLHQFTPELPGIGQLGDMTTGCTTTNQRILLYGGVNGTDPIVAPLRAIRAYYHFWMMELYGDVPILDHIYGENEPVERRPRAEVARWIEKELLEVIPDLTEENSEQTYGRPNKWMAEALLVKLYLNWGVYTNPITEVTGSTPNEKLDECIYWCDQIIQNGPFEVGVGYRKKFYPDNGVHIKDFIYAINFDPQVFGGGTWKYAGGHEMMRWFDYRNDAMCKPNPFSFAPTGSESGIAGIFVLTPECVDRFNLPGDERNEMILVGPQTAFDVDFNKTDEVVNVYNNARKTNLHGQLDYKKEFEWADLSTLDVGTDAKPEYDPSSPNYNVHTATDGLDNTAKGARLYKYPARSSDYTQWGGRQFNDIPVFRYADILLSKAECILRGGKATLGATAASLMTEVRKCSNAPAVTGTPTLDELLDERGREFIMEPWRRNDLIRFGKWENCCKWKTQAAPKEMADKNRRLFPVPSGDLINHTNWTQNPGY